MKYKILLADPPWLYLNPKAHDPAMGGTPYKQMSQADLKSLPVKEIAEKDSILFLWATLPKLPQAFEVMESWGFTFTTVPFVWIKLNPTGNIEQQGKDILLTKGCYSGLGYWTCGNAEIVLMGKRGVPQRKSKSIKQIVFAPRAQHSRKPDEVRQRIVQLMGDVPRIEIFATEIVEGWDSIGGAIDGLDISESLQKIVDK